MKKPQAASEDGEKNLNLEAGLYLVATPIGNLRDISLRALDVLGAADVLLCEDTRMTRKLLGALGVDAPKMLAYNDHSDDALRAKVMGMFEGGKVVALVSDAGMPLVSDPGYKLVRSCVEEGYYVTSLPGASAPLLALQLSGFPSDKFCFIGFLPPKSGARQKLLQDWKFVPGTLIAFETAPRLLNALEDIALVMGDGRGVAVARELTKFYEEIKRGTVRALIEMYRSDGLPKGEIVLVIGPPEAENLSEGDVEARLKSALALMKTKEAAAFVAQETGWSRKDVYEMALRLSKKDN